jgi:GNAT superfamily N-acetyltransferase
VVVREVPVEATRELRRAVLRPHETIEELAAAEAPGTVALGALRDGRLIGVGMITPASGPEGWRIRGMATDPAWRGRGVGTAVLRALLDRARAGGAVRVWCNARTPARTLYEREGFAAESDEFELPMIGPHYVMALTLRGSRQ